MLTNITPDTVFENPTGLVFHPDSDDTAYALQQNGVVWILKKASESTYTAAPFFDFREHSGLYFTPTACYECGLYSMAFHPEFTSNGFIYFSFTEGGENGAPITSYIARFQTNDNGQSLLLNNANQVVRENIYSTEQPTNIHNNGQIKFGPDDYLYVGFGDGGPGYDPQINAQNTQNPFGSILRLKDDGSPAPGNKVDGLPEIYAYGLRNPWNWSFDKLTGEIWLGDVGQAETEEINLIVNGGNYGWKCYEGKKTFEDCGTEGPFIAPVWDYSHEQGQAVTGGYVYRGKAIPDLYGVYLFGDFIAGTLWGLRPQENNNYEHTRLLNSGKYISSFSEDGKGELYITDHAGGGIYKIVAAPQNGELPPVPYKLSETGCVNPKNPSEISEKLVPYSLIEPFWSDSSVKSRYFSLPDGEQITVDAAGEFQFPVGSILVKEFELEARKIETRLLLNQKDTGWQGYSYRWNEDHTEAYLLTEALDEHIGQQIWHYPSRAECSQCHTAAAGRVLGPETRQLDKDHTYQNGLVMNQLDYYLSQGLIESGMAHPFTGNRISNSKGTDHSVEERALSYLHSNCSQCHRPGGISQSTLNFHIDANLHFMNACDKDPLQSDLGITGAKLLTPGDASQSIIWHRLAHNDENRMPPVGSNLIDEEGANLVADWINSLTSCTSLVGPLDNTYVMRNTATGELLYREDGKLAIADLNLDDERTHWKVENFEGYSLLKVATSDTDYLHIEALPPTVGPIQTYWWSILWVLKEDDLGFTISNRWRPDHFLFFDEESEDVTFSPADPSGPTQNPIFGSSGPSREALRWQFEMID